MKPELITEQIKLCNDSGLKVCYEACCEQYRRRLCEQWDMSVDNSFWIAGIIGSELSVGDYWVLDMPEIKFCVDNSVTYEAYNEYWDFIVNEKHNGHDYSRINFNSWFRLGCRPDILKEG